MGRQAVNSDEERQHSWMTHDEYRRSLAMSLMWALLWLKIDPRERRYHHVADDAEILNFWYWEDIWSDK